jgi:ubiquinone biosynthesis protein
MAIGENRGEDVSDMLLRMSSTSRHSDEQVFAREIRRLLPRYQKSLGQMSVGSAMVSIQRLAIDCRVALPLSFALTGKTLSQVDSIARQLCPAIDPMQVIREYEPRLLAAQLKKQSSPGSMLEGLGLPLMAAWRIPRHIEHLLSRAEKGELKIGIVPTELDEAVKEIRTVTNRIAWAVVSASMIVASALLMNVEHVGTIMGYPALGLIGFVLSFCFGLMLLWRMIRTPGGL